MLHKRKSTALQAVVGLLPKLYMIDKFPLWTSVAVPSSCGWYKHPHCRLVAGRVSVDCIEHVRGEILLLTVVKFKTFAVVWHGVHEAPPLAGRLLLITGCLGRRVIFFGGVAARKCLTIQ